MFYSVTSGVLNGIEGVIVKVEVDVSQGIPYFDMTGSLANQVKEAKERVKIAIKNSGYVLKPGKIVVNISPADIRKAGTGLDLPIAVGVLGTMGFVNYNMIKGCLVIGELSLDGTINGVDGILPIIEAAKGGGISRCIVPWDNRKEAAYIQGIEVIGVKNLAETMEVITGRKEIGREYEDYIPANDEFDGEEIIGQEMAKKATVIAAAGRHNIIYIGPPGTGKTMLAKKIPKIMPPLTLKESIALSKIYSVSGLLNKEEGLVRMRPFRTPHNKITPTALLGGGRYPIPGEISLADSGVLFLDELPLFSGNALNALRIPMEEKQVIINRVGGSYIFPAGFMLVGAMNPCPCGNFPDKNKCICNQRDIDKYIGKLEKAFMDRIDMSIEVPRIATDKVKEMRIGITTSDMRKMVLRAYERQRERYANEDIDYNSQLDNTLIKKYCQMTEEAKEILYKSIERLQLSLRGLGRTIKVARTIADVDDSDIISAGHILEAISYRVEV